MNLEITSERLEEALKNAGHNIFKNDAKDYNLNIVGVRSDNPVTNKFNDLMIVAWKFKGNWNIRKYTITTFAGLRWLEDPMNSKGCAILKEGKYSKTWKIRLHRGKYEALCQRRNVEVYRDNNKDAEYDLIEDSVQSGLFGINIHRASKYNVLPKVDLYSAGCQVFQDPKDFDEFMRICKNSEKIWGEEFTYTLINEKDFK